MYEVAYLHPRDGKSVMSFTPGEAATDADWATSEADLTRA